MSTVKPSWRMGEQEGTAAVNAVSSIHTGIYNNSPGLGAERLVVGESSTSVMFDSAAQHWIRIVNHADINNLGGNPGWSEKTIEFWFKSRTLPSDADAVEGVELTERQVLYEQGGAPLA